MALVEIELPHVLAHRVAPHPAARAIANVVVDAAIEYHRAGVFVLTASRLLLPSDVLDGLLSSDQMIGRHCPHHLRTEDHGRTALRLLGTGLDRAAPRGNAIVDKKGEVRNRIGESGCPIGAALRIHGHNPIPHQPPMRLQRTGYND